MRRGGRRARGGRATGGAAALLAGRKTPKRTRTGPKNRGLLAAEKKNWMFLMAITMLVLNILTPEPPKQQGGQQGGQRR